METAREADRLEIMKHIHTVFQAFVDRDIQSLEGTRLAECKGFTVRSRSTIRNRRQYLEEVARLLQHQSWKTYEITDDDIIFYGDTAIVCYIARVMGRNPEGHPMESKLRVMDVYLRTPEGWNLGASSVSLHPDVIDSHLSRAISALTLQ